MNARRVWFPRWASSWSPLHRSVKGELFVRYIACVELELNGAPRADGWSATVRGEGFAILPYSGTDLAGFREFLVNAAALWLPSDTLLHSREAVEAMHAVIGEGKRLFVGLDPNTLGPLNSFLDRYGIEGTHVGVFAKRHTTGHPRLIRITRADDARSFRDERLLEGVESVLIQQPQAIRYGGEASPVLTIPLEHAGVYDLGTDFPSTWTSPEVTCLALSEGSDGIGGVLALSGTLFHDPYAGPLGHSFPGISENRRLAGNVARWLVAPADSVNPRASTAFELVDRIERSLVEYVEITLSLTIDDWWQGGVPGSIRQKCRKRREQEGNQLPESAYLDLSDVPKIVTANNGTFASGAESPGLGELLAGTLSSLASVNEIRRYVMHPSRRFFSGRQVSDSQLSELRGVEASTLKLLQAARQHRRQRRGETW